MKAEMKSLAAIVVQYIRRHTDELGMKNNVVKDSQPWGWRRTRESSFQHRGKTRISARKSE